MKYLSKSFTVPMTSKEYRENFDKIDWGKGVKRVTWRELKERMSPESRARSEARTQEILRDLDCHS